MHPNEKIHANSNLILREIAGEHLLIPVGELALSVPGMIRLSESGLLLWQKLLAQDCTESELVDCILDEYEIDRESAQADVQEFLQKLSQIGIAESKKVEVHE